MNRTLILGVASAAMFMVVPVGAAFADSDSSEKKPRTLRVKLDDLDGKIWRAQGEWLMRVEYEVKIKGARELTEPLTLVIDVLDNGFPVDNGAGEALQIVVPLDRVTQHKKDKIEFEGKEIFSLGPQVAGNLDEFELFGRVIGDNDGFVYDSDESSISFRDGRPRYFSIGVFGWGW